VPALAAAQESLTLQQAVSIALEKNYAIRIAQKNQQIVQNDYRLALSSFLPVASANLTQTNNYNLKFIQALRGQPGQPTPEPRDFSNTKNSNLQAGATLNWTIFDGMGMFIAYQRLGELRAAGDENTQQAVENTVADVSNAYYNIVQQKERVEALNTALAISDQRLQLAKAQYEVGSGSKLNYLAAQVDYNTDKSTLLLQEQQLRNARTTLNQLLGRAPSTAFDISDTIIVNTQLDFEAIRQEALRNNPALKLAERSRSLAGLDRRLIQSERYPQVNLFSGYTHGSQNNQAGFLSRQTTDVVNYGVSASVFLFNGFNIRRRVQNARIVEYIREDEIQSLRVDLESGLQQAYENYRNALELIKLEQQNLDVAQQNVEIALERYRLGVATPLELREVQRNAVATASRLIDAAYNAKLAETELQRLSSSIVQ
jgi:outer membrane protein TolC